MMATQRSARHSYCSMAVLLIVAMNPIGQLWAQCEIEETAKLLALDGVAGDHFGDSVSISGDTAVIGSRTGIGEKGLGGSAYVFEKIAGAWIQKVQLAPRDSGFYFGVSVSILDDTILIGDRLDIVNGEFSGSAYIFERVDDRWMQTTKLLADDGAAGDAFGTWVSISGDTAVITATGDDNANGGNAGAAYVFEKIDGKWQQVAKLIGDDVETNDSFAHAASISGNTIVANAPCDYVGGQRLGSVYVFEKIAGVWQQTAMLNADDAQDSDWFGGSVSIDGNTVVIGAEADDDNAHNSGAAYIFEKVNGRWQQMAKLIAYDGAESDRFGNAVSISGDIAAIGAYQDDNEDAGIPWGEDTGAVYVFKRTDGVWEQLAKLTADDFHNLDELGSSVGISGETVLAGSRFIAGGGVGAAYVFELGECLCPADLDGDGSVGVPDLLSLLGSWGPCPPKGDCPADFDTSGDVGVKDLLLLLGAWGPCP